VELPAGTVLQGTYEVVRRVGAGGMGVVYEGRDRPRAGRRVAIKVLSGISRSIGVPELLNEAKTAATLDHLHIVRVEDFGCAPDDVPFMVMELLEGRDLAAELALVGRLPPARAASIVAQVASAIGYAHGRKLVHLDLKPHNVFLVALEGQPDFVKVLDFGIARLPASAPPGQPAKRQGTPSYMAPEQAAMKPYEIDGRSDEYALAAMTFEMLTGRPPFVGDDVDAVLHDVLHGTPPSMSSLGAEVNAAVEAVVRKGLSRRPDDRFLGIVEYADALALAVRDGIAPQSPSAVATLRSDGAARSRLRRTLFVAAVVVTAAATAIGLWLWPRPAPPVVATPAVPAAAAATPPVEPRVLRDEPVPTDTVVVAPRPAPVRTRSSSVRRAPSPAAPPLPVPLPPAAPVATPRPGTFAGDLLEGPSSHGADRSAGPAPRKASGTFVGDPL
jgi:serine/threonine-protein kinase